MNKKTLSVIFALAANFLLLSHVVIPHHHHDAVACFDDSKCCSLDPNHHHRNQLCDSNHDDSKDSRLCVLELVASDSAKKHLKIYSRSSCNDPVYFHAIFLTRTDPFAGDRSLYKSFDLSSEDLYHYTTYISDAIGLRAPPVI